MENRTSTILNGGQACFSLIFWFVTLSEVERVDQAKKEQTVKWTKDYEWLGTVPYE